MENISGNAATTPPAQSVDGNSEMDAAMTAAMESVMFAILSPQIAELLGASSPK